MIFQILFFKKWKINGNNYQQEKNIQIEIIQYIFSNVYIQHGPLSFVTFVYPLLAFFKPFNVPFIFIKGVRFLGLVIIIVKYDFLLLT
jgi:hypothetical protein